MSPGSTRLFVNGRFLTKPTTGTERFATELLRALDKLAPEHEILRNAIILAPRGATPDLELSQIRFQNCGKQQGHLWEQWELPMAARGGLLLNLTNSGPIFHRRQIVVIHDAAVYRWPQNYSFAYGAAHRLLGRILGRRSRIMTVSAFSQHELSDVLKVDPTKITVIPNGHEHILARQADDDILDHLGLRGREFFLCVGSPSLTKNLATAVAGFDMLNRPDVALVIVGAARSDIFRGEIGESANLLMPGRLTDEEMVSLYRQAVALVFPSFYEGFGIPPLEAMAQGCPIIASRIPTTEEVCRDAALYFDPKRPEEAAAHMAMVLSMPQLRRDLTAKGRLRFPLFSWKKSALSCLENLA